MPSEKKIKNKNENVYIREFSKGLTSENPVFRLLIGLCPALAITTMLVNGIGMGIATAIVLLLSNMIISLLRKFIPEKARTLSFISIIASFVTIAEILLKIFLPQMAVSLGIYLPLISVNCIIMTRAETFANKNSVGKTFMDSLGMGIGFLLALCLISIIREILGTGIIDFSDYLKINGAENMTKFSLPFVNQETSEVALNILGKKIDIYSGAAIFISPAGALFIFGIILAFINAINFKFFYKDKK